MEKGQLSIEVVIIAGVIIAISTLILGKFMMYQDNIFNDATVRQIVISEIEKTNKSYALQRIQTCEDVDTLTVSIVTIPSLYPPPTGPLSETGDAIESKVRAAFDPIITINFDYSELPLIC
ncbi:MAG: hypothetical protein ABIH20_03575 [Candidatus Diapherotrites archaeon]